MAGNGPSSDFLFNLNSFTDTTSSSSSRRHDDGNSNSLLAGLNAFTPQDAQVASANVNGGASDHNSTDASPSNMMLNASSFADQLDLWTNASFSFDGPTGHALLLDEDKDEGQPSAASNRNNNGPNGRGGDQPFRVTPTPAVPNEHRNQPFLRNGKARERNENDMGLAGFTGIPSHDRPQQGQQGNANNEPTHRDHKLAADNFLQSEYFAPPSASASEARRPGFGGTPLLSNNNNAAAYSRRHAENAAGAARGRQSLGENAFSQFNLNGDGEGNAAETDNSNVNTNALSDAAAAAGFNGLSPELFQALAFQHILSGGTGNNALAGINPFAFPGLLGGNVLQGPPQQNNSWSSDQQGQNSLASAAAAHFGAGPVTFGAGSPSGGPQQHQHHAPNGLIDQQQRNIWGANGAFAIDGVSNSDNRQTSNDGGDEQSDDTAEDSKANVKGKKGKDASSKENGDKSSSKRQRTSTKDNNKSSRANVSALSDTGNEDVKPKNSDADKDSDDEDAQIARALRDDIPPLKLIDTGNPEADAEANRLAIEEDKRRRNTAASARFRIKKKQREQALEAAARSLERKVRSLEEENERLSTENGWLKNLITTRPNGTLPSANGMAFNSSPSNNSSNNALLAAAAAAAAANGNGNAPAPFPGMPNTYPGTGLQPMRDTGLQPRGVGTANQQQQQQQQHHQGKNSSANGKKSNNSSSSSKKKKDSSNGKKSGAVVGDSKAGQATLVGGKRGREE